MPSDAEVGRLPLWAQMMYAEDPNVWEVDAAYKYTIAPMILKRLRIRSFISIGESEFKILSK